jgi:L-ribulose-5-phosphate 3-epimerase
MKKNEPWIRISLFQWSLHKSLGRGGNKVIGNLDFVAKAKKDFEIEAVEYVNQFFQDKAKDKKYLAEIKKQTKGSGVTGLLIMIDGEGNLGEPDENTRCKVIENHYKWVDAAKFLSGHSIRVNARLKESYDEQVKFATDGLA